MKTTPRQEAEYALAYSSRSALTSDEARDEYDRLRAGTAAPRQPPPTTHRRELSPVAGKWLAVLSSLGLAVLVLIAGLILQGVSSAKAGLCNTVIGDFAQQQSGSTAASCGLWTGLDTFGQVLTWLGGIGTVVLALVIGLTWLGKLK
ncbi:MAG: hypothetical protein ABSF03_05100 [Streptosporangiaceae bacterium]|jgi:hypothetical protein